MHSVMKLYKLFLPIAAFGLTACSSDFFDDVEIPNITQSEKESLVADPDAKPRVVKAELQAIYNLNIQQNFQGNTAHDYFGLKSLHLATDLMGEDMVMTSEDWFIYDYLNDNREAPYRRTRSTWNYFYKIVASANTMITDYLSEEKLSPELDEVKTQLITLRGIAYFHLVNYYQQTYSGNENALGVPLVLPGGATKLPRASVAEVYQQIIADLTYGVEQGLDTPDHGDADKRVAAAYLAKAYAAMEDWGNVEKYAQIAFQGLSIAMPDNFYRADNADVLWGYDINDITNTGHASFFSHMDATASGYGGALGCYKAIYNKLYAQIPDEDARKAWWTGKDLVNTKFNALPDFTGDYIFIRTADPYLLYVEALAQQGKDAEAVEALKEFLLSRGVADMVEEQDNLNEYIRLQRRIELWGEGSNYFDMKRWKVGIDRNAEGSNHFVGDSIAAGDAKLIYQLPQAEMDKNNLLKQNP